MTARMMTRQSSAKSSNTVVRDISGCAEKAELDSFISKRSWGKMTGKPKTAMMAAFCWACEAMAAKNVNTRLRPQPPSKTRPVNMAACCKGFPSNKVKSSKLSRLISSMSRELKSSFASIKIAGLVMVWK